MENKTAKTRMTVGGGAIDSPLNFSVGQKISVRDGNSNQKSSKLFKNLAVILNLFQHLTNKHIQCRNSTHAAFNAYGKCQSRRVRRFDAPQGLSLTGASAFSIAEAMIVFLVVSIVLGMSAPMISKQIKYNNFSDAQISMLNRSFEKLRTDMNSDYDSFTLDIENLLSSLRSMIESNTTKINNLDNKVNKLLPVGSIIMWSGSSVPENWALCNGQNGTPDLRNRFVVSTGSMYGVGDVGGLDNVKLTKEQMPKHSHTKGTMRIVGSVSSADSNGEVFTYIDEYKSSGALKFGSFTGNRENGWNEGDGTGGVRNGIDLDTNWGGWTGATSEEGSDTAHENRPPYYALAFIMKVK